MGLSGDLEGEPQGELLRSGGGVSVLRYALPGTVHHVGTKRTAPRGAGTGYVDVQRWTGGAWSERLGARFKAPRSESFAAHAWNLFCHLRESGVGTAEPLAMGQTASALFASQSFLVTRALEPMKSIPDYLAEHTDAEGRRCLAHALGLFLNRILEAGVALPALDPSHVFVSRRKEKPSCAIRKIQDQVAGGDAHSPVPELVTSRLPELALGNVDGGRIQPELVLAARVEQLRLWGRGQRDLFSARDLLRIAHYALGNSTLPRERRRALRQLQTA